MSHTAKITEYRRSLIVLVIDQSGSMSEPFGGSDQRGVTQSKAAVVARTSNILLNEIISRCKHGTAYQHYFDIAAIGYSGLGVYSLLPSSRQMMSPAELAASSLRIDKTLQPVRTASGQKQIHVSATRIWIEPHAEGRTPMLAAYERLSEILYRWQQNEAHPDAFPPTVIHITDGEPTDSHVDQLLAVADQIAALGTSDGAPVMFNIHISGNNTSSVIFPENENEVPHEGALLYRLSSTMPAVYNTDIADIREHADAASRQYRALAYNASVIDFIRIMNVGMTTTTQIEK